MADEAKNAPAEESKQTEPATSEAEAKPQTEVSPKEETIGQVLKQSPISKEKDEVPLSAFLEIKKANKELVREMKELKKAIDDGATKREVGSDLKDIANKYPEVDPEFLQDFAKAVRQQSEQELEDKIRPLKEKEAAEKIDKVFNQHYSKALEAMPEYKDIVRPDVIKTLSLAPENASKTFSQLIEETYGHVLQGKRTLDQGNVRSSRNDNQEVDFDEASRNPTYFAEHVANDPRLLKKYKSGIVERFSRQA